MSLQYVKLVSRDPSTPIDGLGGLAVPINFLPLLLVLVGVFLSPTYRQDIACDIALIIVAGSLLWLEQLLSSLFPTFVFL